MKKISDEKTDAQSVTVSVCPCTLADGFNGYSPIASKTLFNNKKVSHILSYETPQKNEAVAEQFIENRKRISISGVQEKLSLRLEGSKLRLTKEGEYGTYILKPIPRDLKKVDQVPANEHLTMQIAKQVYGINVAANAMIFFYEGVPAYITKRFDIKPDGTKWGKEDFATLAGMTSDNAGPDFKYDFSYEEIGLLFQKYVPSWRIEIEKFFTLVLFNYAFSNGDAHLKNFSLLETASGDYTMSPAYDLVNTRVHVDDTDFALSKKLFKDDFKSASWKKTGHATTIDFTEFGKRIGVQEKRIALLMAPFKENQQDVMQLINRSFLDDSTKKTYLRHYQTRLNILRK
ncbi:MAG TPA: HipA domain-containing protein [Cyclobacteriaceae bacterium]|nr:HipA domain-containing protein [Cyclobacteriaceae bacterium]